MPVIKLPDGKDINFLSNVTGNQVAEKISKSLSKQALIMSVDGVQKDLTYVIKKNCEVKIFTAKDKMDFFMTLQEKNLLLKMI